MKKVQMAVEKFSRFSILYKIAKQAEPFLFRTLPVSLFTGGLFLKSDRVGDLTPVVPGVQDSFSGVVVHHDVVAVLIRELYVGVPMLSCLGVVSKVDGSGSAVIAVNTVDHSTGHKSVTHSIHRFCPKPKRIANVNVLPFLGIIRF